MDIDEDELEEFDEFDDDLLGETLGEGGKITKVDYPHSVKKGKEITVETHVTNNGDKTSEFRVYLKNPENKTIDKEPDTYKSVKPGRSAIIKTSTHWNPRWAMPAYDWKLHVELWEVDLLNKNDLMDRRDFTVKLATDAVTPVTPEIPYTPPGGSLPIVPGGSNLKYIRVKKRESGKIFLRGYVKIEPNYNYCLYCQNPGTPPENLSNARFAYTFIGGNPASKGSMVKYDLGKAGAWIADRGDGAYTVFLYMVGANCEARQHLEGSTSLTVAAATPTPTPYTPPYVAPTPTAPPAIIPSEAAKGAEAGKQYWIKSTLPAFDMIPSILPYLPWMPILPGFRISETQ